MPCLTCPEYSVFFTWLDVHGTKKGCSICLYIRYIQSLLVHYNVNIKASIVYGLFKQIIRRLDAEEGPLNPHYRDVKRHLGTSSMGACSRQKDLEWLVSNTADWPIKICVINKSVYGDRLLSVLYPYVLLSMTVCRGFSHGVGGY